MAEIMTAASQPASSGDTDRFGGGFTGMGVSMSIAFEWSKQMSGIIRS